MLIEKDAEKIAEFKDRKSRQLARIAGTSPGLQIVVSGERGTQFMVVCSTDTFYEGVVIGQLPHVVMETYGPPANPRRRAMPNDKKPLDKREIDLTDDQIDKVLACWRNEQSALGLPFVQAVYDLSGLPRTK